MQFAPLRDALYNWFKKESGLNNVVWAEQDAPRPARPYATLRLNTGSVKVGGQDNLRPNPVTGIYVLNGPRTVTVSCNIFGDGALDILTTVRDSLDEPSVIEYLDADGLAVLEDGSPQNITEHLETHYEERAQMDVKFGFEAERDSSIVAVDRIALNGKDISLK